jgi:hypothetical protein
MIDIANEQMISLRDVPKHVPTRPNGKRIHISAGYRWAMHGIRGVQLESIRIGGTTFTSVEALQRFAERLTQQAFPETPLTPKSRQRAIESAASRVAQELGLVKPDPRSVCLPRRPR